MENVYEAPDSNPTQIITPQVPYEQQEASAEEFVPSTGTDSKGFQLKHALIILGVLAIAIAGFFGVSSLIQNDEPVEDVVVKEELNTFIESQQFVRYSEYDLSIKEAENLDVLAETKKKLDLFVKDNSSEVVRNYRLTYLQAKLELYFGVDNPRQIKNTLEKAVRIALANGQEEEMLQDMQTDSQNDLSGILEGSKKLRSDWGKLEDLLK